MRAARLAETEGEGAPAASAAAPAPARLAAAQPPAAGAVAFRGASHPAASDAPLVQEIRAREIAGDDVDEGALELDVVPYETAVSRELFLQWVTPEGRIAGFLRLSLPHPAALASHPGTPAVPGQAMIRELHVYGRTSPLARASAGVQHRGLGRRLVAAARTLAEGAGFRSLAVISAVGTRNYYRALGFQDAGLYQRLDLGTPHTGEGDIR
ncbi:MAG: GNAT family N-acetyltransferase [Eggerthellaceae bacterium]|nr:GNAT family N-acetyltransferase [Eggerthellaceae bacterium]